MKKRTRIIQKALKIFGIFLLSVIGLLLSLIILIRIPAVQQEIVGRAESYLQDQIGTKVSIGHLYLSFPKYLDAENIYLEDQQGDTLLYVHKLSVDTDLWALLEKTIELNTIYIEELVSDVHRYPDSTFNFTYIIEAFDTGNQQPQEPSSKPWNLSIEDIELSNITVDYRDSLQTSGLTLNLGHLEINFNEVDPVKSIFHVANITLRDTDFRYIMGQTPHSPSATHSATGSSHSTDTASTALPDLQVKNMEILNSTILYKTPQQDLDLKIGNFEVVTNHIDLEKNSYDVESILLEKTSASILLSETVQDSTSAPSVDAPSAEPPTIAIQLRELSMAGNEINYSMGKVDSTIRGFNPNHVSIQKLQTELRDLQYTQDITEGTVNTLSFATPDGFTLQELQTSFRMNDSSLIISNFHLSTPNSAVNLRAHTVFSSLENFMNPQTSVELAVDNSRISVKDMLYFKPQLTENAPFDLASLQPIKIAATARGSLQEMQVEELRVALSKSFLSLTGKIGNLTAPESLTFDINQTLTSSQKDLKTLLPDSLYPADINLPEEFEVNTKLAGALNDLQGTINLTSSLGDFRLNGSYSMGADSIPRYDADLATEGFDVGTFLDQPEQFGQLVLNISIGGSGAEIETIQADLEGTISRFDFQQYTYNDLMVDGRLMKGLFDGHLEINDENLTFTFDGRVDQLAEEKNYQVTLDIEKVDLQALNFFPTPLIIAANIKTDIKTEDFRRFNGEVSIHDFSANNRIDTYRVDSLLFTSIDQDDRTEISIDSDLMAGRFVGNVDLFSLVETLTNHFDYYYTLQDTVIRDTLRDQQFELSLDLKKTDLITEILVPQLETFNPGRLEASFNSAERDLKVNLNIKELKYNNILIDSIGAFVRTNEQNLEGGLEVNGLKSSSLALQQLKLSGDVEEDFLNLRLGIRDSLDEKSYVVKGQFESADSTYRFSLDADSLMLAHEMWDVSPNNVLIFGPAGFSATDFILSKGSQQIAIETRENASHRISFDRFRLKTISDAIGREDSLLTGTLNGYVSIEPLDTTFGLAANLSLENIAYQKEQIGTIEVEAEKKASEHYQLNVTSTGVNRFRLNGQYVPAATDQTRFDLELSKIDLASFSTLAAASVKELYGTLTGNLSIAGDLTAPDIDGQLKFSETGITPSAIGTPVKIDNETIRINNSTITFNNFQLKDKNNNSATLNGMLELLNPTLYRFDLDFTANNFLVLDSDNKGGDLYYGKLVIDANADITGTSAQPNVDLSVQVNEESEVSYVIPTSEYTALDQSNVVVFKGPDSLKTAGKATDSLSNEFQGIEMNANLDINEEATFHIIIDPLTGDQLTVQGNANLTVDMNRQGDLQLSGRYELNSGVYNFSFYKLVQREFNISKGSTITWTGDPMEANLNIQASYRIETAPIDLLANQIRNTTGPEYNRYRQQLPFLVYLNIQGELTAPEISFELDMPQAERNALGGSVYARIQDINSRESELNKQVFALLIMRRFISDDPFTSEGGASLTDNTRRSVSRIMSDQLNRLAENIEGVDVSVDLQSYEDYSAEGSRGRTELEVGLSRSLFSERVNVKVTGNVNLEGGERQRAPTDFIGDLVIEYKITEDGRIRATAFRRTDFDVISGEIIETGTGIIYMREYDAFKELFNNVDEGK